MSRYDNVVSTLTNKHLLKLVSRHAVTEDMLVSEESAKVIKEETEAQVIFNFSTEIAKHARISSQLDVKKGCVVFQSEGYMVIDEYGFIQKLKKALDDAYLDGIEAGRHGFKD